MHTQIFCLIFFLRLLQHVPSPLKKMPRIPTTTAGTEVVVISNGDHWVDLYEEHILTVYDKDTRCEKATSSPEPFLPYFEANQWMVFNAKLFNSSRIGLVWLSLCFSWQRWLVFFLVRGEMFLNGNVPINCCYEWSMQNPELCLWLSNLLAMHMFVGMKLNLKCKTEV